MALVIAPLSTVAPSPPRTSPPDAGVIADARARRRRRHGRIALSLLAALAAASGAYATTRGSGAPAAARPPLDAAAAERCPREALGVVAFVAGADSDSL